LEEFKNIEEFKNTNIILGEFKDKRLIVQFKNTNIILKGKR